MQLKAWAECAVNGFFPFPANGAWDKEFARVFSKDLRATFNATTHSYDTWLSLYQTFNHSLVVFTPFNHGFTSVVAIPDSANPKGGFVSMNGWEGGYHSLAKKDLWYSDTAFAVIEVDAQGKRKIVEFREATNMPSGGGVLPPGTDWACVLPNTGPGGNGSVKMAV
ncbi:hypothetical protein P154DRAFT_442098 [Amniculicola lignicola CBS 123094]|uniref:Uncharacterized protein n=1 Tax=Amniculicola lignicola CBS 123094 TaxID=1392246 RepID=A0A6A5W6J7_9PLEO|nr:hypothetical protein P154DRAFT_442098 [Amniculicola lignicola CBS 123094]